MFKRLSVIVLLPLVLLSKDYNIEFLYGFGYLEYGNKSNIVPKGYIQDIGIRATIFSNNFANELVGRYTGFSNIKSQIGRYTHSGWEAEYRFGYTMQEEMKYLDMIMGNAYVGVGYQQALQSYSGSVVVGGQQSLQNDRRKMDFIYMPFGFWAEDKTDIKWLKIRSGINFKLMFFNKENNNAFKYYFNFGGKIYAGAGFVLSPFMDIFLQGYFIYNTPIDNIMQAGIETGIQF